MPSATSPANSICPLCAEKDAREYCRSRERSFLRCDSCGLVFVPASQFLSPEHEKKRYDLHRNSPEDDGYRRFLRRIFVPLDACLAPGRAGLDFGCGPEPLLACMFREAGHSMTTYDSFYEPDPAVLEGMYDFITATEVLEHLREPRRELARLWSCLRPGGVLGIMTRPVVGQDEFAAWHYKNDRTHICFFSPETFRWLATKWGAGLEFPESDIALFRKK
jgi:methyltransferase family protein